MFYNSYFTIGQQAQAIFKDRGSKFIGSIHNVENETEVKLILSKIKTEHPGANHYCYAWRIGKNYDAYRTNDDGEPNNTAGKPIFSVIQSNNLTNTLIVVTRYFGGTQLGVPGLINAYKTTAAETLALTTIVELQIQLDFELQFNVDELSAAMLLLKQLNATIKNQEYSLDNVYKIQYSIDKTKHELLLNKLSKHYTFKLKEV